ncbi:methyltransferase [Peziza echinospora]|nr:methyltransferase [Peziza echinospora]
MFDITADTLITCGLIPVPLLRLGIRHEIADRIKTESAGTLTDRLARKLALIQSLKKRPIVEDADSANSEHYEVDVGAFSATLGPNYKYSGCIYDDKFEGGLEEAEVRALETYVERAGVRDGMRVLDLGCGWGSTAVYVAKKFPGATVVGVSNSTRQKAAIDERAQKLGIQNLEIVTADVGVWEAEQGSFDRVISIEMFEHMKNYELLLEKISRWLKPSGKLFVQVLGHRDLAYEFGSEGWMAKYFFTNGNMPSGDLFLYFQKDLLVENMWFVDGKHYAKTCQDWIRNMERNSKAMMEAMEKTYGKEKAGEWYYRWRAFYLASEELFGYNGGSEFGVFHYLFEKPQVAK